MSTMESPPPPDAPLTPGPPDRRCPRCGSTLAPDQEWCLSCGAAAETEVVEARGWRVPLYLGGGLAALALLGVILAILALANRDAEVAATPTPTPTPSPGAAVAPVSPSPSPLPTTTPFPTTTPDPGASVTPAPSATVSPEPTESATADPSTDPSTFPEWTGADGDYTIIIESAESQSAAEKVAQEAQDAGETVGILQSSDYSSLNGGYWVVFSGTYTSKSDAEDALDGVRANYKDAYVRQIST